jgi:serine/threonine protein kinase
MFGAPPKPTPLAATRPIRNQVLVGRYKVISDGFRGAFGRVHKAEDLTIPGHFVALKFPIDFRNAEHLRRFRRELDTLQNLRHPNVLRLVAKYPDHRPPFAVFEYLSGGTLVDVLRAGQLSFPSLLLVLSEVAGALGAAHGRDGFHRDVKPDNIMFATDGHCVLIDWNLASVPDVTSRFSRTLGGTRGYIDPWVVNKDYDAAADIYSFGITMAEAATAKPPYELVPQLDLVLEPGDVAAPTRGQAEALVRLIKAMVDRERHLRPDAALIQEYAAALAGGGRYPLLPGEIPTRAHRRMASTSATGWSALKKLTAVGAAVLLE